MNHQELLNWSNPQFVLAYIPQSELKYFFPSKRKLCENQRNGGEEKISAEHLEKAWIKENLQKQCVVLANQILFKVLLCVGQVLISI